MSDTALEILKISRVLRRVANAQISEFNLRVASVHILDYISKHRGLTKSQIASSLELDHSTVSRMSSRMLSMGLIEEIHGFEDDDRKIGIFLTKEGLLLLRKCRVRLKRINKVIDKMFDGSSMEWNLETLQEMEKNG